MGGGGRGQDTQVSGVGGIVWISTYFQYLKGFGKDQNSSVSSSKVFGFGFPASVWSDKLYLSLLGILHND